MRKIFKKALSYALLSTLAVTTAFGGVGAVPIRAEAAGNAPYRNVMYYGEWSIYAGQKNFTPDKIDGSLITHLNFAFMDVDANGNLLLCDYWADTDNPNVGFNVGYDSTYAGVLGAMVLLRDKYPNMKIGISVGGWTRSGDFPKLASNETTRKNFAKNIAKFVHYYGYDFVDIDWEYPTADRDPDPVSNGVTVDKGCKGSEADTTNFTAMLQDIRTELDNYGKQDGKHYELSVAMSASPAMMAKIEYDKVLNIVDFANMMTYDLNGAWNGYTGHQTALYVNDAYDKNTQPDGQFSVDTCVKYLEDTYGNKIDYSKIVIGVAPYTRGWAGVESDGRDAANPGLYATAKPNSVKAADGTTSGTFAYSDINQLIAQYNLKEYYDEKAEAAYYYSPETGYFFTCDNERSVAAKGEYVKKKGLGGLISWMASLDSTSSVTKVMKNSLYGNASLPAQEIKVPAVSNISTDVTTSGDTFTIKVKNNNTLTESGEAVLINPSGDKAAMPYAERFAETVTYPKFYIKTTDGEILSGDWSSGGTVSSQDGYTVITPPTWSSKTFAPGDELIFTLKTNGTANASKIESIIMSQKAVESGKEISSSVIYGKNGTTIPTEQQTPTTEKQTEQQTTQAPTTEKPTEQQATQAPTTEKQTNPENNTVTESYQPWASGTTYAIGDIVTFENKVYECTYAHTSHEGWKPDFAFTLWKERTDLAAGQPAAAEVPTTEKATEAPTTEKATEAPTTEKATEAPTTEKATEAPTTEKATEQQSNTENPTVNHKLPQHMVTGYWHNFENGSTNLRLRDVPAYYDMICVAFTGNTATPGEVTFELDGALARDLNYSKAQFIQDIKDLKAKGQHVIISVGGAEGRIEINSAAAADRFADSLTKIIEEYGFEGVDIDLEGSAVSGTDYIADALRKVHDHFGNDFIITMAPETFYVQADRISANDITTAYLRLALKIKDILTICYPQFYNSGGMNGYGGAIVNPGNADFLTSLTTLLIENGGLRPDQLAIGVPSTSQAAGSGYVSPDVVANAVNALVNGTSSGNFKAPNAYPTLRGVMTWSINWDATNNYAWAKAMDATMASLPVVDGGVTNPTNPDTPAVIEQPRTEQQTTQNNQNTQSGSEIPTTGEWVSGKAYAIGDIVTYQGQTYECTYAHTSHEGWKPDFAFTLWKNISK